MKKIIFIPFLGIILLMAQLAHSAPWGRNGERGRDFLLFRLERLSKELNLTADQQSKLDALKLNLRSMAEQRDEKRRQTRKYIESQLSGSNPDLEQISAMMHAQIDENSGFKHNMLSRVSEFCNDLSPEQKKIVFDRVLGKMGDREEE